MTDLAILGILRSFMFGLGVTFAIIGSTQLLRTLMLGAIVTNANAVIRRSGVIIGIGAAFLFAAIAG